MPRNKPLPYRIGVWIADAIIVAVIAVAGWGVVISLLEGLGHLS